MRAALYFLALLLVGVPLLDWGRGIFPAAIGESTWRFAVTQLLSNFLVTPAVGLALAVGLAAWLISSRRQRAAACRTRLHCSKCD